MELVVVLLSASLLLISGGVFFFYHWHFKTLEQLIEQKHEHLKLRQIAAAERFVLFLERMRPENAAQRIVPHTKSATQAFQRYMQSLEEEFFHNVVQQLYLDESCWQQVKSAKMQLQEAAKNAVQRLRPESTPQEFFETLQNLMDATEVNEVENALEILRTFVKNS